MPTRTREWLALIRLVKLLADRVGMNLIHVFVECANILTCLSRLVSQRAGTVLDIASAAQVKIPPTVGALLDGSGAKILN